MKLIIEDDEGRKTVVPFVREEISIGRQEGNTIRLTERNVSRKHARLVRNNGTVLVEDLGSFNGVKVNGDRIQGKSPVEEGDLIEIGDYDLAIEADEGDARAVAPTAPGRVDGRAPTAPPSDARATAPTWVPGKKQPPPDDDDGPPASQSTAVIRPENLAAQARAVHDLPASERPKLVIVSGDQAGEECVIGRTELRIGRTNGDNDLAINHKSISRNHAKVVREGDGGWRAIDLQSANGLKVNGEAYSDAPLAPGDLLELGHVKLRFVGPGQSYHYVAEDDRTPAPRARPNLDDEPEAQGSKSVGLILGGLVAVVALAGGAYLFLGSKPEPKPEPHPAAAVAAAEPKPPPPAPPAPAPVKAPAPATPPAEPSGRSHAKNRQISELLEDVKSAIREDRLAVADDRLKEASKLGADDASIGRLEKQLQSARDRDQIRQQRKAPAAPPPSEEAQEAGSDGAKPGGVDKRARATQTYQDALSLLTSGNLPGAVSKLLKAVALDPGNADAHKALGICYAKLQQPDKGAVHYEQYLKLRPDASDADQVKSMLADYYKSKGQ